MNIALHPNMSAQQIADWCAAHQCIVEISYVKRQGIILPLLYAKREPPDPWATIEDHIAGQVRS